MFPNHLDADGLQRVLDGREGCLSQLLTFRCLSLVPILIRLHSICLFCDLFKKAVRDCRWHRLAEQIVNNKWENVLQGGDDVIVSAISEFSAALYKTCVCSRSLAGSDHSGITALSLMR